MGIELLQIHSHLSPIGWRITVVKVKAKKTPSLYKLLSGLYHHQQIKHAELGQIKKYGSCVFDGNRSSLSYSVVCLPQDEKQLITKLIQTTREAMAIIVKDVQQADHAMNTVNWNNAIKYEDHTNPPPQIENLRL
jgi:uncharacterized protein YpbB